MSAPRLSGVVLAGFVLAAGAPAGAQRAISGARTTIDFTGYAGGGLAPEPAVGQLDSDDWRISGIGGDTAFGGTHTDGAFALGESPGGVAAGGLYAFFVEMNDPAFGWQMATNELTPGAFTVRFVNQTGAPIVDPTLRYELWIRNDSGRSSIVTFAWLLDDAAYTDVPGLAETTTVAADAPAAWVRVPKEIALTGTTIPADGLIYLRWSCDDVAGTGGRDELAIDDIEVLIPGCGDGVVQPGEGCDDGGAADGDGCSAACTPEHGYACDGEPSVCASTCGDGLVASDEGCDDGDLDPGDGCDDACVVEDGYVCLGEPSLCGNSCGDGVIDPSEACDDGGTDAGDGCSDTCGVEGGWTCGGEPSTCVGDGDGDGVPDGEDNCVDVINPSQADVDDDGIGNACDDASEVPDEGGCCAVDGRGGGRAGGSGVLALAVAGLLRRRRRSRA